MPRRSSDTREQVLAAAHDLFYWQGIHATGVDAVAERAQVAPTTLYRLFSSKDGLVAAYAERADRGARAWFDDAVQAAGTGPRARILAVFDALADQVAADDFRGCACMMTLAEYPDRTAGAHRSAVAGKQWVLDRFRSMAGDLAAAGQARNPQDLAEDLTLILEGVLASAQALGPAGPGRRGRALAGRTLDSAALAG